MRLMLALAFPLLIGCSLVQSGILPDEGRRFVMERDGLRVSLVEAPFIANQHAIHRCRVAEWEGVCLIDGRPVFGSDWELPKSVLASATAELGGTRTVLDVSSMYNPALAEPLSRMLFVQVIEGGHTIRACLSDGAGSYVVEWSLIAGAALRTLISQDEDAIVERCKDDPAKARPTVSAP